MVSIRQLSIGRSFANRMPASDLPKAALGDVRRIVLQKADLNSPEAAALPQS